jgi:hypothetical protein
MKLNLGDAHPQVGGSARGAAVVVVQWYCKPLSDGLPYQIESRMSYFVHNTAGTLVWFQT